jgi:hypothetical protein
VRRTADVTGLDARALAFSTEQFLASLCCAYRS